MNSKMDESEKPSDALVLTEVLDLFQQNPGWIKEERVYQYSFSPSRPTKKQIEWSLGMLLKKEIIETRVSNPREFRYKPSNVKFVGKYDEFHEDIFFVKTPKNLLLINTFSMCMGFIFKRSIVNSLADFYFQNSVYSKNSVCFPLVAIRLNALIFISQIFHFAHFNWRNSSF